MMLLTIQHWKLARYFLFFIAVILTVYFGIFDYFKPPFEVSSTLRGPSDRNLHIAALASMTIVLMIGQRKQIAYLLFTLMMIFAVALESMQVFIPSRAASWNDLIASLAGVLIGACLAFLTNYLFRKIRLAFTSPDKNLGRRASDLKERRQ